MRTEDSQRLSPHIQAVTLILIVLGTLGPVLPGVEVPIGNLFPY